MTSYTPEQMREYYKKRYSARRSMAIQILGGKCVKCGSIDKLEIDHIDPKTKEYKIDQMWKLSEIKFLAELEKCQILCDTCHNLKSIEERGKKIAKGTHGTLSSYRYCKCDLCKEAKARYMKNYMKDYQRKK